MKYKVCNKCHRILLLSRKNFSRNKCIKDGFYNTCKDCSSEYRKTPKGKLISLNSNSRGRFKNYIHDINIEMYEEMMNYFDGNCAYTGMPLDNTSFTFEHVIPNSLDGMHAIYNLLPCHKSVNFNKKTKDLLSWYPGTEYYSEERLKKIFEWLEYAYEKYN